MSGRFRGIVSQYQSQSLLVDANLLLLFLVGATDPAGIKKFARTSDDKVTDFEAVESMMAAFATRLVTTPYILTEVSNLANKLSGDRRSAFFDKFAEWIPFFDETVTRSSDVCLLDHFSTFGLTDLGILRVARGAFLVLTDDGRLAAHLQTSGVDVVTLSQLRAV